MVGDGCTDDSEQVVASFGDERVRWHNLEANSGSQATPNNVGLDLARGEYIAYQGHDDVWHPKHLAAMLAHLQSTGADFAYCLAEVLGPPGSRVRYLTGPREADLIPGTWLPPTSIVHRTELARRIGGWRTWEEADGPPDTDFIDRVRESGARLIRVPALTAFKFPSSFRTNAYRDRPSHEQEAYVRRIERERFFIERELAALALRRLSPLKGRLRSQGAQRGRIERPKALQAWLAGGDFEAFDPDWIHHEDALMMRQMRDRGDPLRATPGCCMWFCFHCVADLQPQSGLLLAATRLGGQRVSLGPNYRLTS